MKKIRVNHGITMDCFGELLTMAFIILKVMGKIELSWIKVFLPVIICYVLAFLVFAASKGVNE
jgi:hypothetical protein